MNSLKLTFIPFDMKRLILLVAGLMTSIGLLAQNDRADNIVGIYSGGIGRDAFKASIEKAPDGTFRGHVIWVAERYEKDGRLRLDARNPDKSLRDTPLEEIVLFKGLKYNPGKQQWDGTKIYDPNRGIRANMTATFDGAKTLKIRGSLLGISETEIWTKE